MKVYIVTSHYQSGESTWLRSNFEGAVNLALDLIEEETADQVELLKQEGGDFSIVTHLQEKNYEEAVKLYSEMTSSDIFENRITIHVAEVDEDNSATEIEPDMVDELLLVRTLGTKRIKS